MGQQHTTLKNNWKLCLYFPRCHNGFPKDLAADAQLNLLWHPFTATRSTTPATLGQYLFMVRSPATILNVVEFPHEYKSAEFCSKYVHLKLSSQGRKAFYIRISSASMSPFISNVSFDAGTNTVSPIETGNSCSPTCKLPVPLVISNV